MIRKGKEASAMLGFIKGLFERKPLPAKRPPFYSIVCPFCFSRFEPDEVVFRAAHTKENDSEYALQEDEKLNAWRRKFRLAQPDMEAVIDPNTIPEENRTYSEN